MSLTMPILDLVTNSVSLVSLFTLAVLLGIVAAPSHHPKRKSRVKERGSGDFHPLEQKPPLELPGLGQKLEKQPDIIVIDGKEVHVTPEYLAELAFNDELIEILIHEAAEENAAQDTALVANQGKWAEVMLDTQKRFCTSKSDNGQMEPWGYLPRGRQIVTRRKYVMELAKSRRTQIRTEVKDRDSDKPRNLVHSMSSLQYPFQVFNDHHPKAEQWLRSILR